MTSPIRSLAALALVAAMALGACGSSDSGSQPDESDEMDHGEESGAPAFAESEATTKVTASLTNFAFGGIPATVKGPNVFFTARNDGNVPHEIMVVDSTGKVVDVAGDIDPGKSKTLAVILAPGTYSIECRETEGSKLHTDLGMKGSLTVE